MYYLSVLAIFKNETMNLKLWLDHYLWQGVCHFFLIDNGSTDEPLKILQEYIEKGLVTYSYQPKKHSQTQHYRNMYINKKIQDLTYWLIICDLDEFIYGVDRKLINKIKSLSPHYDYLICNWFMFGSDNNITHPQDIRISNIHREINVDHYTKYIFKTKLVDYKDVSKIEIHNLADNNIKNRTRVTNKLIRLNHYPIQSMEFFTKVKMTRGDCNTILHDETRNMDYFNKYNKNTVFCDEILKNLILNPPENYLDD